MAVVILQAAGDWADHDDYYAKFYGEVQSLPVSGYVGDWLVSGTVVHVTAATRIDQKHGAVAVGSMVEVKGQWLADRTFQAYEIDELEQRGTQPLGKQFAVLKLQATSAAPPAAEGVAVISSFALAASVVREDLKVAVEHLLPAQIYEVYVDGFHAGSIFTNTEGKGYLFLFSENIPGAEPLPTELSPVANRQQVEVRHGQTVVLTGNFANAHWHGDGDDCGDWDHHGSGDWDHHGNGYYAMAALVKGDGAVVGAAVTKSHEGKEKLKLMASALPGSTTITVVVDGIALGTVFTSTSGNLDVTFSTSPDGDDLLLPFAALPTAAWQQIALQDATGQVLASGSFLPARPFVAPGTPRLRVKPGKR